jgi:hypothetical protein
MDLLLDRPRNKRRSMIVKVSQRLVVNEDVKRLECDKPEEKHLLLSAGKVSNLTTWIFQEVLDFEGYRR